MFINAKIHLKLYFCVELHAKIPWATAYVVSGTVGYQQRKQIACQRGNEHLLQQMVLVRLRAQFCSREEADRLENGLSYRHADAPTTGLPYMVLITEAVFLLERGQTDRQTHGQTNKLTDALLNALYPGHGYRPCTL